MPVVTCYRVKVGDVQSHLRAVRKRLDACQTRGLLRVLKGTRVSRRNLAILAPLEQIQGVDVQLNRVTASVEDAVWSSGKPLLHDSAVIGSLMNGQAG